MSNVKGNCERENRKVKCVGITREIRKSNGIECELRYVFLYFMFLIIISFFRTNAWLLFHVLHQTFFIIMGS